MRPTARQAAWLLGALHVPVVVTPVTFTWLGVADSAGRGPLPAVLLGAVVGGLQLRHSFAAARGVRPSGWVWSLLALLAVVYLPFWLLDWWPVWQAAQFCAVASVLMLLRGWFRGAALVVMVGFSVTAELADASLRSVLDVVFAVAYGIFGLVPPAILLYLATRLVLVLTDLAAARAELAESAVGRERLRLSRDLHDLFGQSLSAISLKGDLALRLLPVDPGAAREEVTGLTGLARDTLRRMRAITRDEHAVSLRDEVDGAVGLLDTAGVRTVVDVGVVSVRAQQMFAWAVREGVANVLRHSAAEHCSITVGSSAGVARLEIVNDRARAVATGGQGIEGLAARAELLGGVVTAGPRGDEFRLVVELPEENP